MKRLRQLPILCVALIGLPVSIAAIAQPSSESIEVVCPERFGAPGKPLVSSKSTAIAIFLAVEADFFPRANKEEFPAVEAFDDGALWSVFRHKPAQELEDGSVLVTSGGGQLSMQIAKCDGAISNVHRTR